MGGKYLRCQVSADISHYGFVMTEVMNVFFTDLSKYIWLLVFLQLRVVFYSAFRCESHVTSFANASLLF